MKILVLQGPNLNLVGVKSAQAGKRVTLDKINKILRREVRNTEIELKIFQTHKIYMAISFLHRNRNTASGILIAPMAWAKYEYSLLETLELIQLPIVQVSLDKIVDENQSILSPISVETVHNDDPISVFKNGLKTLIKHLS
jgi:3-dehydroquinate dehydratase-2|tara:strand:- start:463 stop:885 length:423 start_codon:yes stop_codon:yes gene_type:complete